MCLDHVIAVVWLEGSLSEGLSRLSSDNPASESQAMLPNGTYLIVTFCGRKAQRLVKTGL